MYERLEKYRKDKGYTIVDMAEVIQKSPCTYFKKEKGTVEFSLTEALKIASFLNCKMEDIY